MHLMQENKAHSKFSLNVKKGANMKRTELSRKLIIESLLRCDNDITALNGMKFLTTRVSNHIVELRKIGLKIETKFIKTEYTHYGMYYLTNTEVNIAKAYDILESLEDKVA